MLLAKGLHARQVSFIGYYHPLSTHGFMKTRNDGCKENSPGFTLDRLHQECGYILTVNVQGNLEIIDVIVANMMHLPIVKRHSRTDSFKERTKSSSALRIIAHADLNDIIEKGVIDRGEV